MWSGTTTALGNPGPTKWIPLVRPQPATSHDASFLIPPFVRVELSRKGCFLPAVMKHPFQALVFFGLGAAPPL